PFCYATPEEALQAAYDRGEDDEFVKASSIAASPDEAVHIKDGDSVIYMNFRSDRARQLTRAFTDPDFQGFERKARPALAALVTLTEYAADIQAPCAYPPQPMDNV